ncbi:hypothetical protein AB0K52_17615 [Glycomyces sp. NPDC049804]|uniref:hypothetical protein n=1 Tax=Glycomyces sp. NPDC049804 TaxID=3154363 RepID=UPI0034284488
MTTASPPAREHAPRTIWLTAVCIWFRAGLGVLAATGLFVTGIDIQRQTGERFPGTLMAGAIGIAAVSTLWIAVSVPLLRRRRWARRTAIAFEVAAVLFGGLAQAFTDGSSYVGGCFLALSALSVIAVLRGASIAWCSR